MDEDNLENEIALLQRSIYLISALFNALGKRACILLTGQ